LSYRPSVADFDVAQNRPAFYQDSEEVLARASEGKSEGVIAGHLVTTFYYLLAKFAGAATADTAVDGLLADFAVAGAEKRILAKARKLLMKNFEDNRLHLPGAATMIRSNG